MPYFAIILSVFLLDLGTKVWVRRALPLGAEVQVLPFFSLVHFENTGVAFGLFPGRNALFLALGVVIALVLLVAGWRVRGENRSLSRIIALIVGGAMGNLYDRVAFGRVTDFLDLFIGLHHWPAFNVADSAICVGAALMMIQSFRSDPERHEP